MTRPSSALMWGTATLMVTIVSCCSLVGVSIMPLISGPFYKSSITLFTGLAVGSLLGSAIFSLIPQAFGLHLQQDKSYLWKSLIIFFGIYMFYCSERLMKIYFERKERRRQNMNNNNHNNSNNKQQPEQVQLKRTKSNSDVDETNDHNDHHQQHSAQRGASSRGGDVPNTNATNSSQTTTTDSKISSEMTTEISLMQELRMNADAGDDDNYDRDNNTLSSNQQQQHHHHHHHHHGDGAIQPHEVIRKALKGDKVPSIEPRRTNGIAPVAWMIIIGDGLHNFIDGLSIGAAFTESIYQGMIICVAVIFEELPHELGDFAVLISSGMTVKQALGFNFLSACTCYIGMIFGIILGDMAQSASYIFALAAGMFFYISLVDMMGELSAALDECKGSTRESTHLLLMQNIGILSGIIIIFSLSLFGPGG